MTKDVQTTLGPLDVNKLGFVLMQEYVKGGVPGWRYDPSLKFDRPRAMEMAVGELVQAKKLGVGLVVDVTPIEIRDAAFVQDASRASGVPVVCCIGLYVEPAWSNGKRVTLNYGFPSYFGMLNAERIEQIYSEELKNGIGAEHVPAGIIKACAGPEQISENEKKAHRAAARAAVKLDKRVTTHNSKTQGNAQLDIFIEEGLPPHHALIGHCDRVQDVDYPRSLLKRGCYIGFDFVGHDGVCPDEVRVRNIATLVGDGFVKQITMAQNNMPSFHMSFDDMPPSFQKGIGAGKRRLTYLPQDFVPMLMKAGVRESDVHTMTVENPRRYFAGESL